MCVLELLQWLHGCSLHGLTGMPGPVKSGQAQIFLEREFVPNKPGQLECQA